MMGPLRFAGQYSPWLVGAIAIVAAIVVMVIYSRESRRVAMPYSYLLPALRASAVVLVILILAGPVWHRTMKVGELGRVVFAIDASESMSSTDSEMDSDRPQRLERALRLMSGTEGQPGWLEQLSETHEVDLIAFHAGNPSVVWSSRDGEEIPTSFEMEANGSRTDLSSPLRTMLASLASGEVESSGGSGDRRAAVVMFTDGRDNSSASAVDYAKQLDEAGIGVHAIGFGSEDELPDVGIVNVQRPSSVASDGQLSGSVLIDNQGILSKEAMLRIESQGKTVWQETVRLSADAQQSVPFRFDVESVVDAIEADTERTVRRSSVVMDLRAVIDPIDGESLADNNHMAFRVAASTRDRRLLILDGSSRWETRYLRNLFQRDPAWEVETVLFGEGTDMREVKRGEEPGQLPETREHLAKFDAVVLGEIPPDQLTDDDAFRLREFVSRGGGLIVIDGKYDRVRKLAEQWFAELIPVTFGQPEDYLEVKFVRPAGPGLDHPVMHLWGDTEEMTEFWEVLPGPKICPNVKAQEGTEVWADVVGNDGREAPWLATRLFGAGRVFYMSTDHTWRWRYKVADRFHARFWNQLLSAVMQPPYSASDQFVSLGTDRIEYKPGESSMIRARLQDVAGKPAGDATVDALIIANDKVVATVPLSVDDPARGTYQGETPPLEPGKYDIRIQASGFDASALQATTPIWVNQRDNLEKRRLSLNRNALQQVSSAAGGQYFHESNADAILNELKPLSSGRIVKSDILIWQTYYWFWAVIALLGLEWWMRKRAGLV